MSKTAQGLIDYAKSKLGTPYVYGAKMELLTKEKFDWLQKTYGKKCVWDSDVLKVGKICCDCSGLISSYTGIVQGSAQMKTTAKECHPISTIKTAPASALVWQDGHVGIYIGMENGAPMYIAEDGSEFGCRKRELSKASFTHWLLMNYIDYSEKEEPEVVEVELMMVNGKMEPVSRILKEGRNFVELNTLSKLDVINLSYDAGKNLVSINKK